VVVQGVTVRAEMGRIMAAQDEFIMAFQIYDRNGTHNLSVVPAVL